MRRISTSTRSATSGRCFSASCRILKEGEAAGAFRTIHPILAYTSIVGPLMMNAARERVAARPERQHLPMLVSVSHEDLIAHGQETARRMLAPFSGKSEYHHDE